MTEDEIRAIVRDEMEKARDARDKQLLACLSVTPKETAAGNRIVDAMKRIAVEVTQLAAGCSGPLGNTRGGGGPKV